MKATLDCDFRSVYIQPVLLAWSQNESLSYRPFSQCTQQRPGPAGLADCLPLLRRACSAARAVVVKSTRLSFRQVEPLLRNDPTVKVIHLLRNPRVILRSRQMPGEGDVLANYHIHEVKSLCSTILQDWKLSGW